MTTREQIAPETTFGQWVFRSVALAGMTACIALAVALLVRQIQPSWNTRFLIIAPLIATAEAIFSHHILRLRPQRGSDYWRFRLIELLVLLVIVRLGVFLGDSPGEILRELLRWPGEPLRMLSIEVFVTFAFALITWLFALDAARDFERAGMPPERYQDEPSPLHTIATRFFWGGLVLLFVFGALLADARTSPTVAAPPTWGILAILMAYFVFGLILLAEVHFATQVHMWAHERAQIMPTLSLRWALYTALLLIMAGILALLLPPVGTNAFRSLSDVMTFVMEMLWLGYTILFYVVLVLLFIITLPFAWLMSRFDDRSAIMPEAPPPPTEFLTQQSGGSPGAWFDILRAVIFWGLVLYALSALFRAYIADHPEAIAAVRALRPIAWLRRLWRWLRRAASALQDETRRLVASARLTPPLPNRPRMARNSTPLPRTPRERIFALYQRALRQGAKHGLPRLPTQTPHEYARTVRQQRPTATPTIETITEIFEHARYTPYPLDESDVARTEAALRAWEADLQRTDEA